MYIFSADVSMSIFVNYDKWLILSDSDIHHSIFTATNLAARDDHSCRSASHM